MAKSVRILGIGGSFRPDSSSEAAVRRALGVAGAAGAETLMLPAHHLELPMYGTEGDDQAVQHLLDSVRWADGLIIGSPGYHGTVSGLMKNLLDHLEGLRGDERPYLDTIPVGLIACAIGDQAAVSTLSTLRVIVHALRGWPTPLGVTVNTATCSFDPATSAPSEARTDERLTALGHQVVDAARRHRRRSADSTTAAEMLGIAW